MTRVSPADRVLMIISDTTIRGSTRLQKYGFLLHKQYKKELSRIARNHAELKFYDDWKPLWYGPFSKDLEEDIKTCASTGTIEKTLVDQDLELYRYALTLKGRVQWRKILRESGNETRAIHEKIANLQTIRLERLLEGIYHAYPEYTKRSKIKDRF